MQAIILAGGEGQRLRPYTSVLPKPLMPLDDRPILELIVRQLHKEGFTRLTFAVGYLAGLIQAYFGDGTRFGVEIDYSVEAEALGTAGPLSLIAPPEDDFVVMNGDILTDLSFKDLREHHRQVGAIATLAVYAKAVPISLGVLELDEAHRITGYIEKPTLHYPVSSGIYCFRPDILRYLTPGVRCDLPELVLRLIHAGEVVHGYHFKGQWLDIGRREDYEAALSLFGRG